jgi:RNA polymerase-binding transcription factor
MKHYEQRLLELEKTLSARTDQALADGREQFIDSAHDMGDSSVAAIAADDDFTEAELDSTILNQVREALSRIANGTYGKCLVDGGPIETKRLEAVPWAAYCLKHQGLIEAAARPRTTR